ncbi:hypothetical protein B0I21_109131 [Sphingobacterium paludis]|uniref:Uncharacterized protein n=1 Tax=Sphingobacterium paludis TaxID=1476465 RepID=A0A4R7CVU6_9SPHI|nr:hypothetical protein B0I21_109131 [Sphingobacterium paludis]
MLTFHTGLFAMIRYLDATVFSMPLDFAAGSLQKPFPKTETAGCGVGVLILTATVLEKRKKHINLLD